MKKEERKKERRLERLKISRLVFSTLIKVSGIYRVDLAIESPKEVVYKLFVFVCFVFYGAAPIPYVQMTILNLAHPKLRSTTVLLD